ncbi:transporter substrate-binding domain-containing protein [Candidatus Competibacter phosphatis]|uniref:Transporter substrate-binding domain-containing protein n=1 Tax=Candidatus Competibacter phosphatis TaxID=221280 RepID=A0ABX1TR39_9GAMM|nr:ABC transporter substrate-binding protein [Candidatus Competibacter phosphatis]NMQ20474.1 transporter substrate-binding domain-containing protein [Candidatus Competibacter phosphatis]
MPSEWIRHWRFPLVWRIAIVAAGWLILISLLHYAFNMERDSKRIVRLGYMPVISNLAAPLLDYASRDQGDVRFEALKFSSFAEMGEALRNGLIEAAFIIGPLAIVLRQQGEDVKVVYIGNRHESTLVARKDLQVTTLNDLIGKTIAVPLRYSGHNLSIRQSMEKLGLTGKIKVVEMNPPDMAASLSAGSLDAYYVGEPFAAKTLKSGDASLVYYVEAVWPNFICNLTLVKQKFIQEEPGIVKLLVEGAARSGVWAAQNTDEAARIASQYWNQSAELVQYALSTPANRIRYDQFIPRQEEMQQMADLMVHFGLLPNGDITGLVEDRFAKAANLAEVTNIESILQPLKSK